MSQIVVVVQTKNGYPGGNEPSSWVEVHNGDSKAKVPGEGYGTLGYSNSVSEATRLAQVLGATLELKPIGKYLSQL